MSFRPFWFLARAMTELHLEIGERIRGLRIQQELLQRELAARSELPVRTIGRIERGEVDMRISTLRKIANALGIDVKELLP